MGQSGGVAKSLPFGGEERLFRLAIGEWRRIEAKCQAGPDEIAARLAPTAAAVDAGIAVVTASTMGLTGRWRVDDVREVLLQGLIGGGIDHVSATKLVDAYWEAAPMRVHAGMAFAIVSGSLEGLASSAPGEESGEGDGQSLSPMDVSTGPTSSAAAAELDTPHPKSTP